MRGPWVPIMDPQLSAVASVRELGAEAMPPLWQYFSGSPSGGGAARRRRGDHQKAARPSLSLILRLLDQQAVAARALC